MADAGSAAWCGRSPGRSPSERCANGLPKGHRHSERTRRRVDYDHTGRRPLGHPDTADQRYGEPLASHDLAFRWPRPQCCRSWIGRTTGSTSTRTGDGNRKPNVLQVWPRTSAGSMRCPPPGPHRGRTPKGRPDPRSGRQVIDADGQTSCTEGGVAIISPARRIRTRAPHPHQAHGVEAMLAKD